MGFNPNKKSHLNVSVSVEKASLTRRYELSKPGVLKMVYPNRCLNLPGDTYTKLQSHSFLPSRYTY